MSYAWEKLPFAANDNSVQTSAKSQLMRGIRVYLCSLRLDTPAGFAKPG